MHALNYLIIDHGVIRLAIYFSSHNALDDEKHFVSYIFLASYRCLVS